MTELLVSRNTQDQWEQILGARDDEASSFVTKSAKTPWQRGSNTTTGAIPTRELLRFDEIRASDRVLKLREVVQAEMYWEDGLWVCEYESLRIMGYDESRERAVENFCEDFLATYDGLVHENDSSLTVDARLAKKALQHLVLASEPALGIGRGLVGMI